MKKFFYLVAFLTLFICGQVGTAQAQAVLEKGWYYIQNVDFSYVGLQQDASTDGKTFVVLNTTDAKPSWRFYLDYVDEEQGKITLRSLSSDLYITETDFKAEGGMQVMAKREQEAGSVWQLREESPGLYVLYSASSNQDEKQLLRFYRHNVITASEYNVGKNYFWRFAKTEASEEDMPRK